jgi:hypothetical protein
VVGGEDEVHALSQLVDYELRKRQELEHVGHESDLNQILHEKWGRYQHLVWEFSDPTL